MNLHHHENPGRELLKVIAYFNYFRYPLHPEEIRNYCPLKISAAALEQELAALVATGDLETERNYYGFAPLSQAIRNREEGAQRFELLSERISQSTARIREFPFVQLIGLSGSLSKGYAGTRADIDFFIVTQRNRLWVCRSLLHLFKKTTYLRHAQHWYCMNYFIDDTALALEERNYYTAIELVTLKPLFNTRQCYERLIEANTDWLQLALPNWQPPVPVPVHSAVRNIWSRIVATVCGSDRLNSWLMRATDTKWRRKWKKRQYPAEDYELAFKTRINISKNHYHNYQKKMLNHLKEIGNAGSE
jgi:hypothetical protein